MDVNSPDDQISVLLARLSEPGAASDVELVETLYGHLRRIARETMRAERHFHTLQPTALANEVWLKLNLGNGASFVDRKHFFSAVAITMRRILVDHARARNRQRRRPGHEALALLNRDGFVEDPTDDILVLDQALDRLDRMNGRLAEIVRLRWFCDLSVKETAAVIGLSPTTVKREWQIAKTYLYEELSALNASSTEA